MGPSWWQKTWKSFWKISFLSLLNVAETKIGGVAYFECSIHSKFGGQKRPLSSLTDRTTAPVCLTQHKRSNSHSFIEDGAILCCKIFVLVQTSVNKRTTWNLRSLLAAVVLLQILWSSSFLQIYIEKLF